MNTHMTMVMVARQTGQLTRSFIVPFRRNNCVHNTALTWTPPLTKHFTTVRRPRQLSVSSLWTECHRAHCCPQQPGMLAFSRPQQSVHNSRPAKFISYLLKSRAAHLWCT